MDQEIHPCGQGRIGSLKINPFLLSMRERSIQCFQVGRWSSESRHRALYYQCKVPIEHQHQHDKDGQHEYQETDHLWRFAVSAKQPKTSFGHQHQVVATLTRPENENLRSENTAQNEGSYIIQGVFSVTRRSRCDESHSLTHSLSPS